MKKNLKWRSFYRSPIDNATNNLTLDHFCIRLYDEDVNKPFGKTPLAFLLRLSDTLQDWDRPKFRPPKKDESSGFIDQDMSLCVIDNKICLLFPDDQKRFKNPKTENSSHYSKAIHALNECMNETEITNLMDWGSPASKDQSTEIIDSADISGNEPIGSEAAIRIGTDELSDTTKTAEPPAPEFVLSRLSKEGLIEIAQSKSWIVGAINFDEDLHFSSFYLRESTKNYLKNDDNEFGYSTLISFYEDFNETYYIPIDECKKVANNIITKMVSNPLWFQDILEEIQKRAKHLLRVFDFDPDSNPFQNLPEYELLKYYKDHNEAHLSLYEKARIPEALDRGLNIFTNLLKSYLQQRGPDLTQAKIFNKVFDRLTFPEKISVAGMETIEFYNLLKTISSEDKYRKVFGSVVNRRPINRPPF